jgi:hypothetical protein
VTTALQIINRGAEIIGAKALTATLGGTESAAFLRVLNSMVDAWAVDKLFVYAQTMVTATVSGNPVTIGTSQSVNTPRPIRIPPGGFFRSGDTDFPFQMIDQEQYNAFIVKTTSSPWPLYCYYEDTLPTGNLYFYPALASSAALHLPIEKRVTEFDDLDTDYTLPPGFRRALEYSLAEELAPGRRDISPQVQRIAANARRAIESYNPGLLSTPYERRQGNILSGWQ